MNGEKFAKSTTVSFICQRCYAPLRLEKSIRTMTQDSVDQLHSPLASKYCREDGPEIPIIPIANSVGDESVKKTVVRPGNRVFSEESGSNSFTLLGEVQSADSHENLGHRLKVTATLFDFLSGQSSIDHPLCQTCANTVMVEQEKAIKQAEESLVTIKKYMAHLEERRSKEESQDQIEADALEEEEKTLMKELQAVSNELAELNEEMANEEEREKKLASDEKKAQFELNEAVRKSHELAQDKESMENLLTASSHQLTRLNSQGVFELAFHIATEGRIASINGFRMGRLPSVSVDWSEINAGWGQCVLLLDSLIRHANVTLDKYKLVPYGSNSYVVIDKKEYPLYGSSGLKSMWDNKFDTGMAAFLDCLNQLASHQEVSPNLKMPYHIVDKYKLSDGAGNSYSIRAHNQEDQWTKAMTMMLVNLKWAMTNSVHSSLVRSLNH